MMMSGFADSIVCQTLSFFDLMPWKFTIIVLSVLNTLTGFPILEESDSGEEITVEFTDELNEGGLA